MTNTAIQVDLTYLRTVSGGDETFEKLLLQNALSDIQLQVSSLGEAWRQKNAVAVRTAAHTLKSVAAIAGLAEIETLCRKTESSFIDGQFHPEAAPVVYSIIENWQQARLVLQQIIAKD